VKEQIHNIINLIYYTLKIKMLKFLLLAAIIVCGSSMPSQTFDEYCRKQNIEDGLHAHPSECKKYTLCLDGKSYNQECQGDLLFDAKTWSCNVPAEVTCISDFCGNNNKEDGVYAHPSRCGMYIVCSQGISYIESCASGLWFDVRKKNCNYETKVACTIDKQDMVEDNIEALFDEEQATTTAQPDSNTSTALPGKNFQHEVTTFVKKLEQTLANGLSDENKKIQMLRNWSLSLGREIGNMKENMKVEFKSMVADAFKNLEQEIDGMKNDIKDVKEMIENKAKE